jgi:hypothetical protein
MDNDNMMFYTYVFLVLDEEIIDKEGYKMTYNVLLLKVFNDYYANRPSILVFSLIAFQCRQ